jgi:insulysin
MSQLLVNLITDSLTEYSYEAELGGLLYSLGAHSEGLQLLVAGYDDKIPALLRTLLEELRAFKPDPSRFIVMHRQLELQLRNLHLESPYLITDHWVKYIIKTGEWTRDELLEAIPGKFFVYHRSLSLSSLDITVPALERHFGEVMLRTYLEVLIHGNFSKEVRYLILNQVFRHLDFL